MWLSQVDLLSRGGIDFPDLAPDLCRARSQLSDGLKISRKQRREAELWRESG